MRPEPIKYAIIYLADGSIWYRVTSEWWSWEFGNALMDYAKLVTKHNKKPSYLQYCKYLPDTYMADRLLTKGAE